MFPSSYLDDLLLEDDMEGRHLLHAEEDHMAIVDEGHQGDTHPLDEADIEDLTVVDHPGVTEVGAIRIDLGQGVLIVEIEIGVGVLRRVEDVGVPVILVILLGVLLR